MQNETRNSEWNPLGAAASSAKASSGPIIAPAVSIARCTPNAQAELALGRRLSEIIASRGAVRMPLPVRSSRMSALERAQAPPTSGEPELAHGGQPVAERGHHLVAAQAVGREAARRAGPAPAAPW